MRNARATATERPLSAAHAAARTLPDYLVTITTFGMNGFVVGPAVAAMFVAVWHIQTASRFAPPPGPEAVPVVRPSPTVQEHP